MKNMIKKIAIILTTVSSQLIFAAEATGQAGSSMGLYAIAAAIAIGLAALGGALGQGKIGQAAMEGISRNPEAQKNMFVSMIIGLVLIESLVIYALVISILIVVKL